MRSCKILERPYSRHAYATAIEEAEQFLWAGPEMELVSRATFGCFGFSSGCLMRLVCFLRSEIYKIT